MRLAANRLLNTGQFCKTDTLSESVSVVLLNQPSSEQGSVLHSSIGVHDTLKFEWLWMFEFISDREVLWHWVWEPSGGQFRANSGLSCDVTPSHTPSHVTKLIIERTRWWMICHKIWLKISSVIKMINFSENLSVHLIYFIFKWIKN